MIDFKTLAFNIESRPYQHTLVSKTIDSFTNGIKSILIWSPTGSGKSIIGLMVLKQMEILFPNMTFGWVAMRTKLLAQARGENERHVGVKNIQFISMFDKNPPKVDLMVTDECQHDAAATCATMHKTMGALFSLGLTATPFRTDRIKLAYEKVISDCGIRFLIEQNYLCNFNQYVIPEYTPQSVVTRYCAEPERWGKTIIYMRTKKDCYETLNGIRERGLKADIILGDDPDVKRERIYTSFESGETPVLINVYLLTEGFNDPALRTAFIRDSGKLCITQMAGRTFRKDPNNPTKIANIVQSKNTGFPFTKMVRAKTEYALEENQWLSLQPNEFMNKLSTHLREHLLSRPVDIPNYLEYGSSKLSMKPNGEVTVSARRKRKRDNQVANFFNQ